MIATKDGLVYPCSSVIQGWRLPEGDLNMSLTLSPLWTAVRGPSRPSRWETGVVSRSHKEMRLWIKVMRNVRHLWVGSQWEVTKKGDYGRNIQDSTRSRKQFGRPYDVCYTGFPQGNWLTWLNLPFNWNFTSEAKTESMRQTSTDMRRRSVLRHPCFFIV